MNTGRGQESRPRPVLRPPGDDSDRPRKGQAMLSMLRLFGAALVAALCVVLVPSTGWADDPSEVTWSVSSDWVLSTEWSSWPSESTFESSSWLAVRSTWSTAWPQGDLIGWEYSCSDAPATHRLIWIDTVGGNAGGAGHTGEVYFPIGKNRCSGGIGGVPKIIGVRMFHGGASTKAAAMSACPAQDCAVSGGTGWATNDHLVATFARDGAEGYEPPVEPPVEPSCDGPFRQVQLAVAAGTADVSWRWSGGVPARGWELTDAASTDDVGAGTVLQAVSGTVLPGTTSRYGVSDWAVPAGVADLRVQVRADPSCFIGFEVARDVDGTVTGLTPADQTEVDTTPEAPPPTDDEGVDCGVLDVPCVLEYLFVPDSESWDVASTLDQFKARAPFSTAVDGWSAVSAFVGAYNSTECANAGLGEYQPAVSCQERSSSMTLLFGVVQAGLLAATGIMLVRMLGEAFS